MLTFYIILAVLTILSIGFYKIHRSHTKILERIEFGREYRNKYIEFIDKFFRTYDTYDKHGDLDGELYIWLTKNSNRIQNDVGVHGIMEYIAPFQMYQIHNYQIILNTIPKFREGRIESFDVNSVDDCLLRHLGEEEERIKTIEKNLFNPIIWFRLGCQEILSIPLYFLGWFGIFNSRTINKITNSVLFKILVGIISLVTLISSIVTIIQGKELTLNYIHHLIEK